MTRPTVPIEHQIAAVEREIGMRRRVYPRQVAKGQMTEGKASLEIECMEAVLLTLRQVEKGELLL